MEKESRGWRHSSERCDAECTLQGENILLVATEMETLIFFVQIGVLAQQPLLGQYVFEKFELLQSL